MDTARPNRLAPAQVAELTSANDTAFAPEHSVRMLVLDAGATRVKRPKERTKRDELWQGNGYDPAHPDEPAVPLYMRLGEGGALVAELLCGCLARALQLPAPDVFLVAAPVGRLPRSKFAHSKGMTLCVGTRDIGGKTFSQLLAEDADAALPLLRDWPELGKVAAFDEWLANPDRNTGNLIYVAQTMHIIDHAEAFGGCSRELFPLGELTDAAFSNVLGEMVQRAFDHDRKHGLLSQTLQWLSGVVSQTDIGQIVESARTEYWLAPADKVELLNFIKTRLAITHALLCHRLGHPQLKLLSPPH